MKRILCILLLLTLLPLPRPGAETPAAEELDVTWMDGKKAQDRPRCGRRDDTAATLKRAASSELTTTLPEGAAASQLYVRTDTLCARGRAAIPE